MPAGAVGQRGEGWQGRTRDVVPLFHMELRRRLRRGETRPPRVQPLLGGDALTGGVAGVQEELPHNLCEERQWFGLLGRGGVAGFCL